MSSDTEQKLDYQQSRRIIEELFSGNNSNNKFKHDFSLLESNLFIDYRASLFDFEQQIFYIVLNPINSSVELKWGTMILIYDLLKEKIFYLGCPMKSECGDNDPNRKQYMNFIITGLFKHSDHIFIYQEGTIEIERYRILSMYALYRKLAIDTGSPFIRLESDQVVKITEHNQSEQTIILSIGDDIYHYSQPSLKKVSIDYETTIIYQINRYLYTSGPYDLSEKVINQAFYEKNTWTGNYRILILDNVQDEVFSEIMIYNLAANDFYSTVCKKVIDLFVLSKDRFLVSYISIDGSVEFVVYDTQLKRQGENISKIVDTSKMGKMVSQKVIDSNKIDFKSYFFQLPIGIHKFINIIYDIELGLIDLGERFFGANVMMYSVLDGINRKGIFIIDATKDRFLRAQFYKLNTDEQPKLKRFSESSVYCEFISDENKFNEIEISNKYPGFTNDYMFELEFAFKYEDSIPLRISG